MNARLLSERHELYHEVGTSGYTILVDLDFKDQRMFVRPGHGRDLFTFPHSNPELVEAMGHLFIDAAKLASARFESKDLPSDSV